MSYDGLGVTSKTWMLADYKGSIVATMDAKGVGTGAFSYGPLGETSGVNRPRFMFTGQQYFGDLGLGLYYYKARFYSPSLGRFLQTDPAGMKDDLNLYAYVGNNPVNRVDPTGLAKVAVGDKKESTVSDDIKIAALDRGGMYACDIISSECKGSVLREFPGQYLNSTLKDIQSDANGGDKDARKALKLLNDNRFKK
ncbi:MAG: RHS repeat-associated core domain-containing protein [Pseudomonadota bacterium]|nr:RHS repeat-associated core domain-containing protein [Pseudomonadota bacterium]